MKVNGWKKLYHTNFNQSLIRVEKATLISDKLDFRAKIITRNRGRHYIMIKGSVHQNKTAVLNMYVGDNRIATYVDEKLIEVKGEISPR